MPASMHACSIRSAMRHLYGWSDTCRRAAIAVEFVGTARVVLRLAEVGQHRLPVPALAATLTPLIVIGVIAAHVDHAVDRAGATENLAARLIHDAVVEVRLRLGIEHPVHSRIDEGLGVTERNVDPRVGVLAAGLQQQNAMTTGFGKPGGEHTARRTRASHNEVVGVLLRCHAVLCSIVTPPGGPVLPPHLPESSPPPFRRS